jgi:hypothetical protein
LLNNGVDSVSEQKDVVKEANGERETEAGMEESGIGRRLLFENLDSAVADPSPDLTANKGREHDEEPGANFVPEYGHREAGLGNGEPGSFGELLDFHGAEPPKEYSRHRPEKQAIDEENEVHQDLARPLAIEGLRPGRAEDVPEDRSCSGPGKPWQSRNSDAAQTRRARQSP